MIGRRPKATLEQYLLIRTRAAMGVSLPQLAREYGLPRQSVHRIVKHGLKNYEARRGDA